MEHAWLSLWSWRHPNYIHAVTSFVLYMLILFFFYLLIRLFSTTAGEPPFIFNSLYLICFICFHYSKMKILNLTNPYFYQSFMLSNNAHNKQNIIYLRLSQRYPTYQQIWHNLRTDRTRSPQNYEMQHNKGIFSSPTKSTDNIKFGYTWRYQVYLQEVV